MSVRFLASAYGISVHETDAFSAIFSFTNFSTSRSLLFRQWRAGKIKRQFIRSDVTSFLRSVTRDHLVQRPMQQMRHGYGALELRGGDQRLLLHLRPHSAQMAVAC